MPPGAARTDSAAIARLQPPALALPDISDVRAHSIVRTIMFPEQCWPRQILEQPVVALEVSQRPFAFIADPEIATAVLTGGETEFPKAQIYERIVGAGVGAQSLSVATGEQWRRLRRAFAPLFRPDGAGALNPLFLSSIENVLARWRQMDQPIVDISHEAVAITFEIIWKLLFGEAGEAAAPAFVHDAGRLIHEAQIERDMRRIARELDNTAARSLDRRPKHPIVAANPFAGDGEDPGLPGRAPRLTAQELLDNARLLLGAGHETTAPTVTWALWLLGHDREMQARVHDELDAVLRGQGLGFAHLASLRLLSRIVDESLRLYPPGAITVRRCARDTRLGGHGFTAGTLLAVNIYALHRHRSLWRDADVFLPDRFDASRGESVPALAFIPFSAGSHVCVGAAVGRAEAMTILAAILREFRVVSLDDDVKPQMLITIRPDRAVRLRIEQR